MSELKAEQWLDYAGEPRPCYPKAEVDTAIAELKDVIHELQVDLEGVKATAYADSVDAGMRERRLRRALYKACANWAKCEEQINNRDAYDASEYLPSTEDRFRKREKRWCEMATKCLEKAKECK